MKWRLVSPGWQSAPAFSSSILMSDVKLRVGERDLLWTRWDIPELRLSMQASLLLVQGLPLQKLFEYASFLEVLDIRSGDFVNHEGPFILLKASYFPFDPIPRLTNVILGRVGENSHNLTEQEILGALVQEVVRA